MHIAPSGGSPAPAVDAMEGKQQRPVAMLGTCQVPGCTADLKRLKEYHQRCAGVPVTYGCGNPA